MPEAIFYLLYLLQCSRTIILGQSYAFKLVYIPRRMRLGLSVAVCFPDEDAFLFFLIWVQKTLYIENIFISSWLISPHVHVNGSIFGPMLMFSRKNTKDTPRPQCPLLLHLYKLTEITIDPDRCIGPDIPGTYVWNRRLSYLASHKSEAARTASYNIIALA